MIDLSISTMVYRPIQQVFAYVSAPENDFQWQYGTLATTRLSQGASARGSSFRSIANLMGHRVVSTYEVTEYEPNRKYGFTSRSGPLQSQTSYTFEMANGGTKITMTLQADTVGFFAMKEGAFTKGMKTQLRENLAMLKELLEARHVLAVS